MSDTAPLLMVYGGYNKTEFERTGEALNDVELVSTSPSSKPNSMCSQNVRPVGLETRKIELAILTIVDCFHNLALNQNDQMIKIYESQMVSSYNLSVSLVNSALISLERLPWAP